MKIITSSLIAFIIFFACCNARADLHAGVYQIIEFASGHESDPEIITVKISEGPKGVFSIIFPSSPWSPYVRPDINGPVIKIEGQKEFVIQSAKKIITFESHLKSESIIGFRIYMAENTDPKNSDRFDGYIYQGSIGDKSGNQQGIFQVGSFTLLPKD